MDALAERLDAFQAYALLLALYPLDPDRRIYIIYLLAAAVFAYFVYRGRKAMVGRPRGGGEGAPADALANGRADGDSFLSFLFPRYVWRHPSAWLDVRYFFFHSLIGHFLMLGLTAGAAAMAFAWTTGGLAFADFKDRAVGSTLTDIAVSTLFMIFILAVVDFIGYAIHYLQHKVPVLWQFHKVHHSAEVMHPLSNFREHPVDNFVYKLFVGLGYGGASGAAVELFGYLPGLPSLLGVPLAAFAFNLVAYNLRHSHVWLRWPGRWSMVFPSPAHHQVHHSRYPDHIDKNFAFIFPIWDVIFRTYCMPEDESNVEFGVTEGDDEGLTSCLGLYLVPFRDAGRIIRAGLAGGSRRAAGRDGAVSQ